MADATEHHASRSGGFDDLLARGLRGLIEDDPQLELVAEDVAVAQLTMVLRAPAPACRDPRRRRVCAARPTCAT